MIFVTLGTQDKSFERLLKIIDEKIENKTITEEVIVQSGYTKYKTQNFKIFDYVSNEDFEKYIKECSILITHAGAGSILTGLKYNKRIMVMPRLSEYKEQHNNHQLELVNEFTKRGYVLSFNDSKSFDQIYKKIKTFKPKKYISNTKNMIQLIKDYIDNN